MKERERHGCRNYCTCSMTGTPDCSHCDNDEYKNIDYSKTAIEKWEEKQREIYGDEVKY